MQPTILLIDTNLSLCLPSGYEKIAMKNGPSVDDVWWFSQFSHRNMGILHSYVKQMVNICIIYTYSSCFAWMHIDPSKSYPSIGSSKFHGYSIDIHLSLFLYIVHMHQIHGIYIFFLYISISEQKINTTTPSVI